MAAVYVSMSAGSEPNYLSAIVDPDNLWPKYYSPMIPVCSTGGESGKQIYHLVNVHRIESYCRLYRSSKLVACASTFVKPVCVI